MAASDDVKCPFKDIPELLGPLENGLFVRPAHNLTNLYYRFDADKGEWSWTPDQERSYWMPTSTITVTAEGKFKGKRPAHFNVGIINYLEEKKPVPPKDLPVMSIEQCLAQLDINIKHKSEYQTQVAQTQALMGGAKAQDSCIIINKSNENIVLTEKEVQTKDTLIIRSCSKTTFQVDAYCTKLIIDRCDDCKFVLKGKVITSTAEIYLCNNSSFDIQAPMKTVQADSCKNITVDFEKEEYYQLLVWAGTRDLTVKIRDTNRLCQTGYEEMQKKYTTPLDEATDQFYTRIVDDEMITEKVVRLQNGFPTTVREKKAYDKKQEENFQQFAKNAGIKFYRKEQKVGSKQGRNSPCECGSGKKYKKCCGSNKEEE